MKQSFFMRFWVAFFLSCCCRNNNGMMPVLGQPEEEQPIQVIVDLQITSSSSEAGHVSQSSLRGRNEQERTDPEYCDWCGRSPANPSLGVVISNYEPEGSTTTCMGLYQDGLEYEIPAKFCNPIRIALNEACGCEPLPQDNHDRRYHRALAVEHTDRHSESLIRPSNLEQ
jgi:hypothetical protein